jgi:hypothetical protein
VNGQTQDATANVAPDPNLPIPMADFRAQTEAALKARDELSALDDMVNRIDTIKDELHAFRDTVQQNADDQIKTKYVAIMSQGRDLSKRLDSIENRVYNTKLQRNAGEDDVHYLSLLHGNLEDLAGELGFRYDAPPNQLMRERMTELFGEVSQTLNEFNTLLKTDVARYNKAAHAAGAPTVFAGSPITVQPTPAL